MSFHRVLVGMTICAPADFSVGWAVKSSLAKILASRSPNGKSKFDFYIIDNDSRHHEVTQVLSAIKKSDPGVEIFRYSPQVGWAGARNVLIQKFMAGTWDRLVMLDHDIGILDPSWIDKVENLIDIEPDLHAYMALVDRCTFYCEAKLPRSGIEAVIALRYEGGCHIISREVAKRIGGYNCTDFPFQYGLHDAEFGARLASSGLLAASFGHFADPLRVPMIHLGALGGNAVSEKKGVYEDYFGVLVQRLNEIRFGKRLFIDYAGEQMRFPDGEAASIAVF